MQNIPKTAQVQAKVVKVVEETKEIKSEPA